VVGRSFQRIPVWTTNRMPPSAARFVDPAASRKAVAACRCRDQRFQPFPQLISQNLLTHSRQSRRIGKALHTASGRSELSLDPPIRE
jgi:hypothetical protein